MKTRIKAPDSLLTHSFTNREQSLFCLYSYTNGQRPLLLPPFNRQRPLFFPMREAFFLAFAAFLLPPLFLGA